MTETKRLSVFIYVTHLLGSGHLSRALAIAEACYAQKMKVTLATGGFPTHKLKDRPFDIVQLPPCKIKGTDFSTLYDENDDIVDDDWRSNRTGELLAALIATNTDIIITELFPLGRHQMKFELEPFLQLAQKLTPAPTLLCSVRDILQPPSKQKKITRAETYLEDFYDGLLVHGDSNVALLANSFPLKAGLLETAHYTGYIFDGKKPQKNKDPKPEIIVSAGGGAAGTRLYETAVEASKVGPKGYVWRLLVGKGLPQAFFDKLLAESHAGLIVEWARPDFPELLANAALSISQAGYNTMLDIVNARVRSITVPFSDGGELEQEMRARLFEKAGYTSVLANAELNARSLSKTVDASLVRPVKDKQTLNLEGSRGTAQIIKQLWEDKQKNV